VSVSFVVTQLDVTIVNIAIPTLSANLHASVATLQWIVDAYIIAFAGLMLSAGALGDRYGARAVFAAGIILFGASSFVCGMLSDPTILLWARAVQGIAAALMLPNSLSLLNQACSQDPKLRARAVALWTAAGGIALTIGPIVGGAVLNAARQAGGAVGVAIFGALVVGTGGSSAMLALKEASTISVLMLLCAPALACLVQAQSHTLPSAPPAGSS